jgi:plasmid replication initiation protein
VNLKKLMARNKKIYHRNDARHALSGLKLQSRRILWLTLAQQDKDQDGMVVFDPDRTYVITAKEYAKLCDVDESVAYKQLKEGIKEIRTYPMEVPESEILSEKERAGKVKDRVVIFTVANHGVYSDGGGYVELKLDPIIAPYISNLKSQFTGQFLLSALRLPDTNANRLYLLLREWVSSGMYICKDVLVEELKAKLYVENIKTYTAFKDFNKLFIVRSINKIIESTEFTKIDMEIIERRKRKAYMVRISYEYEGQEQDLRNSGFYLGQQKQEKQAKEAEEKQEDPKPKKEKPDHPPSHATKSADMKQINGKWETRASAEAAGYIWDDY